MTERFGQFSQERPMFKDRDNLLEPVLRNRPASGTSESSAKSERREGPSFPAAGVANLTGGVEARRPETSPDVPVTQPVGPAVEKPSVAEPPSGQAATQQAP